MVHGAQQPRLLKHVQLLLLLDHLALAHALECVEPLRVALVRHQVDTAIGARSQQPLPLQLSKREPRPRRLGRLGLFGLRPPPLRRLAHCAQHGGIHLEAARYRHARPAARR